MTTFLRFCLVVLGAGAVLLLLSCGGSNRMLQSITVTPDGVNAQNFPNKQVQFSAMGNYTSSPMTAATPVLWSIGNPFQPGPFFPGITIDQTGLVQCTTAVGDFSIFATAPPDPKTPLSEMGPLSPQVSGIGHLTCP
jgi:hypothetical protein